VAKRTASAKKQARAGARRAVRNKGARSEVKTLIVKARRSFVEAPAAGSDRAAVALEAIRALDRASAKGILHTKNASRRKSRIAKQLAKVAVAPVAPAKGKKAAAPAAAAPAPKKK
jgi:small subunit ribosomal protein S20